MRDKRTRNVITSDVEERMALVVHRLRSMLVALRVVAIHGGHPLLASRAAQLITALTDLGGAMGGMPLGRNPTMPRGDYRNSQSLINLFGGWGRNESRDDPALDDELAWQKHKVTSKPPPFGFPAGGDEVPHH